ncbi:MAG: hypothetical protein M0004_03835 [Actinomycetota bacterium]|nr:hypothetical protein [Actinomycetota bacterium]
MRTSIHRPPASEPLEDPPQMGEGAASGRSAGATVIEPDSAGPPTPRQSHPSWARGDLHIVARLIDEDH